MFDAPNSLLRVSKHALYILKLCFKIQHHFKGSEVGGAFHNNL